MTARPVEHSTEERCAEPLFAPEPCDERKRLALVEVSKLYALTDVEGRGARVLDEVGGRGDAEQAEREAA